MTDPFELKPWNSRPAPLSKVVGFGDIPNGLLVFLACGHSLSWDELDDIPLKGAEVGCTRCLYNPPIDPGTMWGRGVA